MKDLPWADGDALAAPPAILNDAACDPWAPPAAPLAMPVQSLERPPASRTRWGAGFLPRAWPPTAA